jgi:ketosteroid isomerase-like protein
MQSYEDLTRRYLQRLQDFGDPAELLHADFQQREFPNLLNAKGQISDLADALRRSALGRKLLAQQHFDITNYFEAGQQAVVEATWTGTIAESVGPFRAGQQLKAFFCFLLEFRDGRIYRQRNYDCFEPF